MCFLFGFWPNRERRAEEAGQSVRKEWLGIRDSEERMWGVVLRRISFNQLKSVEPLGRYLFTLVLFRSTAAQYIQSNGSRAFVFWCMCFCCRVQWVLKEKKGRRGNPVSPYVLRQSHIRAHMQNTCIIGWMNRKKTWLWVFFSGRRSEAASHAGDGTEVW